MISRRRLKRSPGHKRTGSRWRSYFECDTRGLKTRVRAQARRTRIGLRLLVKGAVRAVALKANTNVRALARIIEAVLGGSMLACREEPYPQSAMTLEYSQVGALDVVRFD
jgi:hypothetical protein